jgi:hypothetical protein
MNKRRGPVDISKESNVLVRRPVKNLELTEERTYSRQEIDGEPVCGSSIPEVGNSTWAYTSKDGSGIRYTCSIGFSLPNGEASFEFKCSSGQTLPSKIEEACAPIKCLAPPAISHSKMEWPYQSRFAGFGTVVDFNCNEGYSGDGYARGPRVVKMQCGQSGEFEFVLPTITDCKLIYCSPPIRVLNGAILEGQVDTQSPVPFNETLRYSCNPGFVLLNDSTLSNFTLTCGDDGEFLPNDPIPTCTEAICGIPPVLPLSRTPQRSGRVKVGSRVLYRCDPGFFVSEIPASTTFNVRCDYITQTYAAHSQTWNMPTSTQVNLSFGTLMWSHFLVTRDSPSEVNQETRPLQGHAIYMDSGPSQTTPHANRSFAQPLRMIFPQTFSNMVISFLLNLTLSHTTSPALWSVSGAP